MILKTVRHIYGDGKTENRILIVANPGMALTDDGGKTLWNSREVTSADGWAEVELPADDEEATEIDYIAALSELGVSE